MPQIENDPFLAEMDAYRTGVAPKAAQPAQDTFLSELDGYRAQKDAPRMVEGPLTDAEKLKFANNPTIEISGSNSNKLTQSSSKTGIDDILNAPAQALKLYNAAGMGVLRGGKNIVDAGAHGLAYGFDKINHMFGGSSDEYNRIKSEDKSGQDQFKQAFQQGTSEGTAAHGGVIAGEIGGSLLLPEAKVMQGATLVPRFVNGALNGGIINALMGESEKDSSAAKNAGIGAAIGGTVNAVLPPVIQKITPSVQKLAARLFGDATPAADASIGSATPAISDAVESVIPKPRLKLNTNGTVSTVSPAAETVPQMAKVAEMAESGSLPAADQAARSDVLKSIGLDTKRPSTLQGDKFASGNEYQVSHFDTPSGQLMRNQLAKEQAALNTYGNNLVKDTGGTPNATPTNRGEAILSPLKGLSDWFDNNVNKLYSEAKDKAGQLGAVKPDNLEALMKNNDFRENFLSSTDGTNLLGSIDRQIKRFQGTPIAGEAASAAPNTVESAENLRKWLNNQWTPQNSQAIGKVKQALDFDVGNAGGENVYKQARQLHALRAETLDNPKGIASLLSEDGINRAVPIEKVANKIASMPDAQFGHIVSTIKGQVPAEVSPQATNALNEIRAHLMEQLVDAGKGSGKGSWDAAAFNKKANELQGKLGKVFSDSEIANIKRLHDAGYILSTPKSYPGAAAQAYNVWQKGGMTGAPTIGAALGGAMGGGMGAVIGSAAGGLAGNAIKKSADASNAAKLADVLMGRSGVPTSYAGQSIIQPTTSALIEALRQRRAENVQGQ